MFGTLPIRYLVLSNIFRFQAVCVASVFLMTKNRSNPKQNIQWKAQNKIIDNFCDNHFASWKAVLSESNPYCYDINLS